MGVLLPYLVKWNVCWSVYNHSNICFRSQLNNTKSITSSLLQSDTSLQMFKVFVFGIETLRWFRHWSVSSSMMFCWIQNHIQLIDVPHCFLINTFLHHSTYRVILRIEVRTVKPSFHYPIWRPELMAQVDGWPVSITRQHGPCWRVRISTSWVDG